MMHTVRVLSGIVYHARDLGTSTERLSSAGILQGWGSNWPGWPDEVPEVEIGGVVEELGTYAPISVRKIGIMFGGRYVGLGVYSAIRLRMSRRLGAAAAAAVQHNAHNLRTPKHGSRYRYGRRRGRHTTCYYTGR